MKCNTRFGIYAVALICLWANASVSKADDLIDDLLKSDSPTSNIDSEALKLDPALEVFVMTASPDQLNLRLLQTFASKDRPEKALIYANKILESPTASKADKIAVLNGANWTVRRIHETKVSRSKDAVTYDQYWSGLIGMTDHGSRMTRYYRVGTTRSIDEAEFKQMAEDNIKYRKMLLDLDTTSKDSKINLAREYFAQEKSAEALLLLEELYRIPAPAADGSIEVRGFYTDVCMLYGNALFMKGDLQGALAVMEKYLEDGVFDRQKRGGWSMGKRDAGFYLYTLRDHGRFNDIKYPHYTGAKAYPEAKEAEYSETFVPLTNVKLELGNGLTKDSPQVRYLTTKLTAYGIAVADSASFIIRFNTGAASAPEKSEAYTVKVSGSGADLQGADPAGTTWAASAFVQLIDHADGSRIRVCTIRDWPDLKFRGNWGKSWDIRFPEYFITGKLNLAALGSYLDDSFWSVGLTMPMKRAAQKEYIKLMRELGINVYITLPTSWYMPKTSERTLQYYTELCNEIAELGGNAWWLHDDTSAGGQPEWDMQQCNGDVYKAVMAEFPYLNKLHAAIKKNHPDFKLLFSPIYYFFNEGQSYEGISKEKYMSDLGKTLDKEIEVMWCGPRVRGTVIKKEQIDYWTSLAGRKPAFWQNPYGPHESYHIVLGDCFPGWAEFHYKGFFDDVTMYFDAGDIGIRGAALMEYANFAWNLVKQENCSSEVSENTQRLAYEICYGKGAFETIKPGATAIWELDAFPTYFATYMTHDNRSNVQRALMEYEHVMTAIDVAEKAWARMEELYPEGLAVVPTQYVEVMGRGRLGNVMDKILQRAGRSALMEAAAKAGLFNAAAGDQFKSPAEFYGGAESQPIVYDKLPLVYDKPVGLLAEKQGPYRKKVLGAGAKDIHKDNNAASSIIMPDIVIRMDQIETKFFRDKNAKGGCELILCGRNEQLHPETKGCKIEVLVNDQKVFDGETVFPDDEFGIQKISIPASVLKDRNTLVIRNLDKYDTKQSLDNPDGTVSFFSIKYGVISCQ